MHARPSCLEDWDDSHICFITHQVWLNMATSKKKHARGIDVRCCPRLTRGGGEGENAEASWSPFLQQNGVDGWSSVTYADHIHPCANMYC